MTEVEGNWYFKKFHKRLDQMGQPNHYHFPRAGQSTSQTPDNLRKASNFQKLGTKETNFSPIGNYYEILNDLALLNNWDRNDEGDYAFEDDLYEDFNYYINIHEHILDVYKFRHKEKCTTVPIMALLHLAKPGDIFTATLPEWIKRHSKYFRKLYIEPLYGPSRTNFDEKARIVISDIYTSCGKYHNFNKFYLFNLSNYDFDKKVELPADPIKQLLASSKHVFCEVGGCIIFMMEHNSSLFNRIRTLRSDMTLICECK